MLQFSTLATTTWESTFISLLDNKSNIMHRKILQFLFILSDDWERLLILKIQNNTQQDLYRWTKTDLAFPVQVFARSQQCHFSDSSLFLDICISVHVYTKLPLSLFLVLYSLSLCPSLTLVHVFHTFSLSLLHQSCFAQMYIYIYIYIYVYIRFLFLISHQY